MIICNSYNFVLLRVPKVASTSIALAIYDSDLVSLRKDVSPGLEQEYFVEGNRSHKGRLAINGQVFKKVMISKQALPWEHWWPWPKMNPMFFSHATYDQLVTMDLIKQGMPSYATIRHPVDRFLSVWSFLFSGLRLMGKSYEDVFTQAPPELSRLLNCNPDEFFDMFLTLKVEGKMKNTPLVFMDLFRKPQTYWGNEDTQYWAVEHLDKNLAHLFNEKGVDPVRVPHLKRDGQNDKRKYLLSVDRQKSLLDMFQADLIIWEAQQV